MSINRLSQTVKNAPQKPLTNAKFQRFTQKFNRSIMQIKTCCSTKNLHNSNIFRQIYNTTCTFFTKSITNINGFIVKNIFRTLYNNNRSVNRCYTAIFYTFHIVATLRYVRSKSPSCCSKCDFTSFICSNLSLGMLVFIRTISSLTGNCIIFKRGAPCFITARDFS